MHLNSLTVFFFWIIFVTECYGSAKTINLNYGQNGSIYSPNYPYSYGRGENCRWLITAPFGQRVLIYFTSLDLEAGCCNCDTVKIFDGSSDSYYNKVLTKGCGSSLPPPVYSSGRNIYAKFSSDGSGQGKGFVAHYKALNSSSGG